MIGIYREGEVSNIGLSIGWVGGPVVCFVWHSLAKDTMYKWYFRIRNIPNHRFVFHRIVVDGWKKSVIDSYLMITDQRLVTREYFEDACGGKSNG